MASNSERRPTPWIAFAAGAVAMLALALLWFAWMSRDETGEVLGAAAAVADRVPDVVPPTLPQAPHIPDAPKPIPK
jgi:hypothetical protein